MVVEIIGNNVFVDGVKTELSKAAKYQLILSRILNPDILELILACLPADEMLSASLVCYSWYHTIATSSLCMSKIKVTYKQGYDRRQNRQRIADDHLGPMLEESIRRYVNIKISTSYFTVVKLGLSHALNVIDILKNSGRKWKEIKVSGINFENNKDYETFLKAIAPNVTELSLRSLKILDADDDYVVNVNFPKLKNVDILYCDLQIMTHTFTNCLNLVQFKYSNGTKSIPTPSSFKKILKMNANLKTFEVTAQDVCYSIFDEKNYESYACKLKTLSCSNFYSYNVPNFNNSFILFLKSQSNSLKEISVTDCVDVETIEVLFNNMKVLKKVSITHLSQFAKVPEFIAMKTNKNCPIKGINLAGYISCQSQMLVKIMKACPNLKYMCADSVTDAIMDRVVVFCPQVKHLQYRSIYNSNFYKHRFFIASKEIKKQSYHSYHEDKYISD